MYAEQNIGLRPVRTALKVYVSCRAAYHSLLEMFMGRKIIKAGNVC
jgi:hypothetical protein